MPKYSLKSQIKLDHSIDTKTRFRFFKNDINQRDIGDIAPLNQTFRSPIDVAYPGAILNPFSKGNGISPWFEMSTLTPASSVIPPIYCSLSIFSSRLNPKKQQIKD